MSDPLSVFALAASVRPGSFNRMLVGHIARLAAGAGTGVTVADYADYDVPSYHDGAFDSHGLPEGATRFAEALLTHDAAVIGVPEYNWSYPGSLKNIVDWVSRLAPCPLAGAPVLLVSASPSLHGGIKGLLHFKVVLEALGAFVYPRLFTVSDAQQAISERRVAHPRVAAGLEETVTGFLHFAQRLSALPNDAG